MAFTRDVVTTKTVNTTSVAVTTALGQCAEYWMVLTAGSRDTSLTASASDNAASPHLIPATKTYFCGPFAHGGLPYLYAAGSDTATYVIVGSDQVSNSPFIFQPLYSDVATDVAAILVDTGTTLPALIGTPVADLATDIASISTLIGTPATDVITDMGTINTLIGTPAGADLSADVAAISTLIGTPAGADVSTDIATIDTAVTTTIPGVLGTPAGADLSTDIAALQSDITAILLDTGTTLDTKIDSILVDTGTTLPATLGAPAGASLAADIAAIKTVADTIATDTTTDIPATLGAGNDAAKIAGEAGSLHAKFNGLMAGYPMGVRRYLVTPVTAAANAGRTVIGTVTGTVMVHNVTIRSGGANADLTTCLVSGGPAAAETAILVNVAEAIVASLNTAGDTVSTQTSISAGTKVDVPWYGKNAETLITTLAGGGATAVALEFVTEWSPLAAGSTLT